MLLGREPKDFDDCYGCYTGRDQKTLQELSSHWAAISASTYPFHDEIIEVATFRSNSAEVLDEGVLPPFILTEVMERNPDNQNAQTPMPNPERPKLPRMLKTKGGMILRDNVFGSPEEDALRRDFTVNALFYSIEDFTVIDYVGGMKDLLKRIYSDHRRTAGAIYRRPCENGEGCPVRCYTWF